MFHGISIPSLMALGRSMGYSRLLRSTPVQVSQSNLRISSLFLNLRPALFAPRCIRGFQTFAGVDVIRKVQAERPRHPFRINLGLLCMVMGTLATIGAGVAKAEEKKVVERSLKNKVTIKIWLPKNSSDKLGHIALETEKVYLSFRPDRVTASWPTFKEDVEFAGVPTHTFSFYSLNTDNINKFCESFQTTLGLKELHDAKSYSLRDRIKRKEDLIYLDYPCSGFLQYSADLISELALKSQSGYPVDDNSDIVRDLKRKRFHGLILVVMYTWGNLYPLASFPTVKVPKHGWLCADAEAIKSEHRVTELPHLVELFAKAEKQEASMYNLS